MIIISKSKVLLLSTLIHLLMNLSLFNSKKKSINYQYWIQEQHFFNWISVEPNPAADCRLSNTQSFSFCFEYRCSNSWCGGFSVLLKNFYWEPYRNRTAFLELNGLWVIALVAAVVALYLPADTLQFLVYL
jgi:hypothetical protein